MPVTQELSRNDRYAQWAHQGPLTVRNFDFVQSPEVEAGMVMFDPNFQDIRRMSNGARHG